MSFICTAHIGGKSFFKMNNNEDNLYELMDTVDRIAEILETGYEQDSDGEFEYLSQRLEELTGRTDIDTSSFAGYYNRTSLEELARSLLLPIPERQGLSDNELESIIFDVCEGDLSDSELAYYIEVLRLETGLTDIYDYLFYPNMVGLDYHADTSQIAEKIFLDRRIQPL